MDRRTTVVALLLSFAAVALAAPKKSARPAKPGSSATPSSSDKQPTLHVRSIDLPHRTVFIELSGFSAVPPANLFTFTDERARKFVATDCRCQPPFPSGTRACDLEIPAGYERHRLVSLLLHKGGLHGKEVTADDNEIASAWAHAIPSPSDGGAP